jgi:hypothetical protein
MLGDSGIIRSSKACTATAAQVEPREEVCGELIRRIFGRGRLCCTLPAQRSLGGWCSCLARPLVPKGCTRWWSLVGSLWSSWWVRRCCPRQSQWCRWAVAQPLSNHLRLRWIPFSRCCAGFEMMGRAARSRLFKKFLFLFSSCFPVCLFSVL